MLPVYSQTSSAKSSDSCIVPISTLRNALIVLKQRDNLKEQIQITRDSIKVTSDLVCTKDSIIKNQESIIELYKKNESDYKQILVLKNSIVEEYKIKYEKQKKLKYVGYGVGVLGLFIAIIK